jgi:hypothetical protein
VPGIPANQTPVANLLVTQNLDNLAQLTPAPTLTSSPLLLYSKVSIVFKTL